MVVDYIDPNETKTDVHHCKPCSHGGILFESS